MSLHAAMEIDLPVTFTVIMIDGHAIGIALIPVDGKHASFCLFQYFNAFLFA
jgi:hypothetical protein